MLLPVPSLLAGRRALRFFVKKVGGKGEWRAWKTYKHSIRNAPPARYDLISVANGAARRVDLSPSRPSPVRNLSVRTFILNAWPPLAEPTPRGVPERGRKGPRRGLQSRRRRRRQGSPPY